MFWCVSFSIYPIWDSLGFLDSGGSFLSHCREVFKYILLKYFLIHFPFLFFFWNSNHLNAGVLKLSQRSLRLSSFIFILLFFFCSSIQIFIEHLYMLFFFYFHSFLFFFASVISTILSCISLFPYPFFPLSYSTVGSSKVSFISVLCCSL